MNLTERNRSRALWTLVALTAIYGLFSVIVYEVEGTFGTAWFATSLVVYGVLLVGAIVLALIDPGRPVQETSPTEPEPTTQETAPAVQDPATLAEQGFELVSQETLYETPTGRVVRAAFQLGDTRRETLFAISQEEVVPIKELEGRLDDTDLRVQVQEIEDEVDEATEQRAHREPLSVHSHAGSNVGKGSPRTASDTPEV